jgi:hypothetical protein
MAKQTQLVKEVKRDNDNGKQNVNHFQMKFDDAEIIKRNSDNHKYRIKTIHLQTRSMLFGGGASGLACRGAFFSLFGENNKQTLKNI